MGNRFYGEGNLGTDPELHQGKEGDEESSVCNMRVFFDRPVPRQDESGFDDKGGFWMNIEIWGKRAVICHDQLSKGNRVSVEGSIIGKTWKDQETGEDRSNLVVRGKRVNPDLVIVDAIKPKVSKA